MMWLWQTRFVAAHRGRYMLCAATSDQNDGWVANCIERRGEMVFCKACGATIDDDARFCRQCGADQSTVAAGLAMPSTQSESEAASMADASDPDAAVKGATSSLRRKRLLIVVGLIGLAVLAGVVVVVVTRGEEDPFVGYWQGAFRDQSGQSQTEVVRIEKIADGYLVTSTALSEYLGADPWVAKDGMLVASRGDTLTMLDSETLEFTFAISHEKYALKRIGQGEFDKEKNNELVRDGLASIYEAIVEYHSQNNWSYPSEATQAYLEAYVVPPGPDAWPTNPFDGQPMSPGTGPGQYSYSTDGGGFALEGYGADGDVVWSHD